MKPIQGVLLVYFTLKNGLQTKLPIYWTLVVPIRSAGTAAGDFTAHSALGLPLGTLLSGLLFVGFLVFWPAPGKRPEQA